SSGRWCRCAPSTRPRRLPSGLPATRYGPFHSALCCGGEMGRAEYRDPRLSRFPPRSGLPLGRLGGELLERLQRQRAERGTFVGGEVDAVPAADLAQLGDLDLALRQFLAVGGLAVEGVLPVLLDFDDFAHCGLLVEWVFLTPGQVSYRDLALQLQVENAVLQKRNGQRPRIASSASSGPM